MVIYYIGLGGIALWIAVFVAGIIRRDDRHSSGKWGWLNTLGFTLLSILGQKPECNSKEERKAFESKCTAASVTITLFPICCILASIVARGLPSIIIIVLSLLPALYIYDDVRDREKKRKAEIEYSLPRIVTKMSLMIKAGMNVNDAWNKVAYNSEGVMYDLMREVSLKISNSVPEYQAYKEFIRSCDVPMVERFVTNIARNRVLGNAGLECALSEMSTELWSERIHRAEEESVGTANKLLIPSMMIFVGILIMIIAPLLMSI